MDDDASSEPHEQVEIKATPGVETVTVNSPSAKGAAWPKPHKP